MIIVNTVVVVGTVSTCTFSDQLCYLSDYLTGMSVNAALNQPTYQASNYGAQFAYMANDGNYNTASCTSYGTGIYWWAVDLSQPKLVRAVNVTNEFHVQLGKMPVFLAVVVC